MIAGIKLATDNHIEMSLAFALLSLKFMINLIEIKTANKAQSHLDNKIQLCANQMLNLQKQLEHFGNCINQQKYKVSQLENSQINNEHTNYQQHIIKLSKDFEQQKSFTKNSFENFREIIEKLYKQNQSHIDNNRNTNNKLDSYSSQILNFKEQLKEIKNSFNQHKKFTENSLSYFQKLIN